MPGSTLARRGATGGYVIAYAVTLASFIVIWFNHPILLSSYNAKIVVDYVTGL